MIMSLIFMWFPTSFDVPDKLCEVISLYMCCQSHVFISVWFLVYTGGFGEFCRRCCHLCEGNGITASPNTPRKKPSLSFPLGEHKNTRPTGHCNTQSYQEEIRCRPPTEVLPFLYIGNAENAANQSLLKELGVTAVLNVSSSTPKYFESSFEYKQICVLDNHQADLLSQLNSAIEFIGMLSCYEFS